MIQTKIPVDMYVTLKTQSDSDNPLGFLVPDGTDKAADKRKATATDWAENVRVGENTLDPVAFKNEEKSGFKILHTAYRYKYTTTVPWRIYDPRGFELEINSNNLQNIISQCTITNGKIAEQLIWGRSGAFNVLLVVDSPEHKEILAAQNKIDMSISFKDVEIGNIVNIIDHGQARYMGTLFEIQNDSETYGFKLKVIKKKKYVFYSEEQNLVFSFSKPPKIDQIIDNKTSTIEETEKFINDTRINNYTRFEWRTGRIIGYSSINPKFNKFYIDSSSTDLFKSENEKRSFDRMCTMRLVDSNNNIYDKLDWLFGPSRYRRIELDNHNLTATPVYKGCEHHNSPQIDLKNAAIYIKFTNNKTKNELKYYI